MNEQDKDDAKKKLSEFYDLTIDQIMKLGALRDAGLLTEEEFSAKKSELLARL